MNTDEQYGECFNPKHITNCNGSYKDCATPSDPVEELVSKLMLKVSGIIKKYGNPTVYPPEMNKELDAAYYEAKAKINRLLVEARKKEAEYWDYNILPAHRSEQLAKDASKRIAELNNQLNEGGEK